MKDLTVVILTKNEEENIVGVVRNALQVTDKVLVVDSGSTDRTVELAEELGARVVFRAWDNDFAAQRNFALAHVVTELVLYLDADERMNDELAQAVRQAVMDDADFQYAFKRKSVAFGVELNYGVLKIDCVNRLFRTQRVRWVNKVHERPVCEDAVRTLQGYAKHYTYTDWVQYMQKFNQYTTIWANNAYENGKRVNLLAAFGHASFGFLQMYILKKGFLDGGMGLVLSCYHFSYTLMKYLKLIDLQRKRSERA